MKREIRRIGAVLLSGVLLAVAPSASAAAERPAEGEVEGPRRHCLSASPLKPFFGLVLVDYEYAVSQSWSVSGSVDYLYSSYLLSKTLGALYGEGFEHPELVVRAGPRLWLSPEEGRTLAGPYLGANAGYLRSPDAARQRHALSLGAEAGWRFPFAGQRAMAMPRLQASIATSDWKPLLGAELLLGLHF